MKRMLLMVAMTLSIGVSYAGDTSSARVNPVPSDASTASQQLVSLPQQAPSEEIPACFPQPCSRCYAKINACKEACNGDPECILDCDSFNECQYCCY
ncbi:hypothetical protein [Hyalangium minutum]|uniref:Uncharacterized protein n=1 Tax=Hyalangium minutum TaxID=394096 RepID=A0A085W8G7_9BACT|nr:hypothetical protein [Hyalangium minutum]KFE63980.1 hypothetical protein DB31_2392 [Hyalangium minutum]